MKPAAKRPPGRPVVPPELRQRVGTIRLTEDRWAKFAALGGVDWLRSAIDRAKVKPSL